MNKERDDLHEAVIDVAGVKIVASEIEETKEFLDTSATREVLLIATALHVLQQETDRHANELQAEGFVLKADEAKQRAAQYEAAFFGVVRQWPTDLTEALFAEEETQTEVQP